MLNLYHNNTISKSVNKRKIDVLVWLKVVTNDTNLFKLYSNIWNAISVYNVVN